ncbi:MULTISPECIES: tetratricopeptide repeat protein [Flavobacterium]|uniref:Tol-pal system YbgF family protein n=1 Tax=Flavobacterium jumunjinense TaxID=998845 RepID=A0ABV5GMV2_9FLAO|nr:MULTISPECIES: tetratricopeptide repeat protein [Flavobacterium]
MKKIIALLLLFTSFLAISQKKMMKKVATAFEYYKNDEKLKAVTIFQEVIKEYPKSDYYGKNLYNIPTIYQELGETDLAIEWYKKVLEDNKIKDSEEDHSRGIFETNANYKHYSATNIGVINYNNKNYTETLKYYKLAATTYPYFNSSETDLKLNKIKISSYIADCYIHLKEIDSAIVVLLPHALTTSPTLKNQASEKIMQLLHDNNKKQSFKTEFEKAIESARTSPKGIILTCYNIEIELIPYSDEELTTEYLKNTNLYKEVNKTDN